MSRNVFALLVLLAPTTSAQIVFAPPQPHPVGHLLLAPLAGDLDLDGQPDLVAQGAFPGPFQSTTESVLLGTGGGAFASPVHYFVSAAPVGEGQIVDLADFDGPTTLIPDGLPDVALGGVSFGTMAGIGWMAGNGAGGLGFLNGFNLGNNIVDVQVHDIENDGDLDFFGLDGGVPIFLPAAVIVGVGNGNGGYSFTTAGTAPTAATFLALADIDANGLTDALCNSTSGGTITLFRHGAGTSFLPPATLTLGGTTRELAVADLGANGVLDVLVANSGLDAVQVLTADGSGGLQPPVPYAAGHLPSRLAVGDLDGDGLPDALVSADAGEVAVLQGAANGTLAKVATVSSPLAALGLALADLDGDGDLDAAVARAGSNGSVDTLENATYNPGSPFTDLGKALKGTPGYPIQLADGTLVAGQPFTFDLLNAKPNSLTTHVVGLSPLFAPYKGGTMVPTPNLLNVLVTDAAGEVHLAGPWPAGGSGATLWLQFWITDAGGVKGKAASNAVEAQIP